MTLARLVAPLAALALVAAGCGSSSKNSDTTASTPAPAATTTSAAAPQATTGQAPAVSNAKDLAHAPKVAKPSGDPPTSLVKKDLVVGTGKALKAGQTATVQYLGLSWSNGQVFDASWNHGGQPISFPIGVGQVIPGWDQGVPGMRVGGRRELVIPGELAYGQSPPPGAGIAPGETLVFVIDLKKIG
jgi:peptidylprolyl isomerase